MSHDVLEREKDSFMTWTKNYSSYVSRGYYCALLVLWQQKLNSKVMDEFVGILSTDNIEVVSWQPLTDLTTAYSEAEQHLEVKIETLFFWQRNVE